MQIEAIPMLINGDFLNAPLDVKLHLADYKMHGKKSYVFQIKDLLHGIYECAYISLNDQDINGEALDYLLKNNKHAGEMLTQIVDIERKDTFKTLGAMTTIANNTAAMTAVLNSSTAIAAITNSSTAMQAVASSSTAMQAVASSSTAMQAVASSSTAMQAVLASSTAMQAVLASSTAIIAIMNSSEHLNEKMLTIMGKSKVALDTFKNSETAMVKFNNLSDALRAKFADEVEKKNINHAYYTSGHIIQAPTFLCEYTNGQGYSSGGNGGVGKSIITLAGESAQQNISVKNKFITDFDYNSGALSSNNFGYPQYCKNVSIICA